MANINCRPSSRVSAMALRAARPGAGRPPGQLESIAGDTLVDEAGWVNPDPPTRATATRLAVRTLRQPSFSPEVLADLDVPSGVNPDRPGRSSPTSSRNGRSTRSEPSA
jgi:hypothetical protein